MSSCCFLLHSLLESRGLSSQFSSLSFWSFRATSTLASGAGVNSANSLVRSLAPEALTFLTHGSVFPSSMSSQQVVTTRSGTFPRRFKNANLGLIFAACGGFCFSAWPCLGSLVEGQTQWEIQASKVNASAFFFIYALGAVIAVLFLLPPLCRWPLHTGVSLNFWRTDVPNKNIPKTNWSWSSQDSQRHISNLCFFCLRNMFFIQNSLIPFAGENGFSYIFRKELYRTEQLATFLGPFWWLCSWLGMFIVNPSWSKLGKCHGYVHYSMSAIGLCLLGCACLGRTQWSWIQNNLDFYWHAPHVPLSPDFLSSCNCRCKLNILKHSAVVWKNVNVYIF